MTKPFSFLDYLDDYVAGNYVPVYLDVETTIENGSPMPQDEATLVLLGVKYGSGATHIAGNGSFRATLEHLHEFLEHEKVVLVGHNIKFDLRHLMWFYPGLSNKILEHKNLIGIWDTMVYEYLESGQVNKNISLSNALARHGIEETKNDVSERYFKKGLGADHVPPEELDAYLRQDLEVTAALERAQFECGTDICKHMFVQGWALLAYARMEDNGLPLMLDDLNSLHDVLENSVNKKRALVEAWAQTRLDLSERIHVTNRVLSTIFFGQPGFPVKVKRVVGKYKNGKPKYKTVEERVHPKDPLVHSPAAYFGTDEMHNPNLGWKMDDHVLEYLSMCDGSADAKMAAIIRKMRAEEKVLGTYLKPFIEKQVDGAIHHNINQCSTATGRTSSSNPNSQNMPDEVRKLIGVEDDVHKILQLDFSQLEMCAAAQLSNDPVMIHDVQHKDVHFETGKVVFGWKTPADMDKHSRRLVKGVNFGTIYGGGPKTLSEQTGADENLVRKLQDAFKTRYPIFSLWQKNLKAEVGSLHGGPPVTIDADGQCYYTRMWRSTTGRVYGFQEMRNPYNGKIDVSPSCIVNYPVQGFATGDIIPLFIAYVFGFCTPDECLAPINAVHDSIVAVVPDKQEFAAKVWLEEAVEYLPRLIHWVYGIEMSMELKVDIEVGDTWS